MCPTPLFVGPYNKKNEGAGPFRVRANATTLTNRTRAATPSIRIKVRPQQRGDELLVCNPPISADDAVLMVVVTPRALVPRRTLVVVAVATDSRTYGGVRPEVRAFVPAAVDRPSAERGSALDPQERGKYKPPNARICSTSPLKRRATSRSLLLHRPSANEAVHSILKKEAVQTSKCPYLSFEPTQMSCNLKKPSGAAEGKQQKARDKQAVDLPKGAGRSPTYHHDSVASRLLELDFVRQLTLTRALPHRAKPLACTGQDTEKERVQSRTCSR